MTRLDQLAIVAALTLVFFVVARLAELILDWFNPVDRCATALNVWLRSKNERYGGRR